MLFLNLSKIWMFLVKLFIVFYFFLLLNKVYIMIYFFLIGMFKYIYEESY